ncbi:C-type mannose receptor 2-like [Battus philenor]|uniref:C-type mannose receptor 2-like n=1 Tax=Battus philenor TaxID=42288 RepID=UPI0035D12D8C
MASTGRCIAFVASISLIAVIGAKQFRCDYRYFPIARAWFKLHRVPANWAEARLRCHLEGGNLASPTTFEFNSAMSALIGGASGDMRRGIFTGIHAIFSRGDLNSIEGVPLSKIPHMWAAGQPDNHLDQENCISMLPDETISDVDCNKPLPYICYKKDSSAMVVNNCGTIDNEYTLDSRTGSCYKFHTLPRTWSRAYMTCAAEGGHLVVINSDTEAQVVKELFAKYPPIKILGNVWKDMAYIGFHDWNEHGEWLTIHGETLKEAGYDKFQPGEPNNSTTGEFCGGLYRTGKLDDIWCENKYAFICEKRPTSLLCDNDF